MLAKKITNMTETDLKQLFQAMQKTKLMAPATNTVLSVGEDGLALSINRIGDVDYFAVLTRKPMIADFKPVQIEVAIARIKGGSDNENQVQVLRFANILCDC
jgi:DNA topoisomerase-6 subunit B